MIVRVLIAAGLLAGAAAGVIRWIEAEREIRVLCLQTRAGSDETALRRMLATGHFLEVRELAGAAELTYSSPANWRQSRCTVQLAGGRVRSSELVAEPPLSRMAAVAAVVLLVGLAAFQILLAAGTPWGRWAWGGRQARLPGKLRVGSAISVGVVLAGAVAVCIRAEFLPALAPEGVVEAVLIGLTLLFALSTLANAASESGRERATGTPLAFLLAVSLLAVAWGV